MTTKKLSLAALVLLALSGILWYSNNHPDWGKKKDDAAQPVLLNVADTAIQSIEIQQKDQPKVVLERQAGKWQITAPAPYPADQEAVGSLVSSLAPANGSRVVEKNPADVAKYGLASPSTTVTIHQTGGRTDQILFGDSIDINSEVYARVTGNARVLTASSAVKTALDRGLNDLRDKRLLTVDASHLTSAAISSAKNGIEFSKNAQGEWTIVKPERYRADTLQVDEVLRKLIETKMDLNLSPADIEKIAHNFNTGKPVAEVKLTDPGATQTFEIRQSGDDYLGKSSAVPGVHKLTAELVKDLQKPVDDFRNKKLFDFGFSDPTRFEIQGKTFTKNGNDWKMDGKNMDPAAVEDLVFKLRDLAATGFATDGFTAPSASIAVVSNLGKTNEKVEFSKTADGYLARRVGEPYLYKLDANAVSDILETSNKVKPLAGKQ